MKRFRTVVRVVNVVPDGSFQLSHAVEGTAADALFCEIPEPAFDLIPVIELLQFSPPLAALEGAH